MNPREIEVHIEELVLHGFPAGSRWDIADALEQKLRTLVAEGGLPRAWQSNPERIVAGTIQSGAQKPAFTGEQIGRAVYEGRSQ